MSKFGECDFVVEYFLSGRMGKVDMKDEHWQAIEANNINGCPGVYDIDSK